MTLQELRMYLAFARCDTYGIQPQPRQKEKKKNTY